MLAFCGAHAVRGVCVLILYVLPVIKLALQPAGCVCVCVDLGQVTYAFWTTVSPSLEWVESCLPHCVGQIRGVSVAVVQSQLNLS